MCWCRCRLVGLVGIGATPTGARSKGRAPPRTIIAMNDGTGDAESRLARIERLLESGEREVAPAWRRATRGEPRWAVTAVILVAVALQWMLPHRLAFHPDWALPALELVLLAGLVAANPRRVSSPAPRGCGGGGWL